METKTKSYITISDLLIYPEQTYAHRKNGEIWETLEEHTQLCQKYFQRLKTEKRVDDFLKKFMQVFLKNPGTEAKTLFQEMFDQVVTFHDAGKINPLFQTRQMNRPLPVKTDEFCRLGDRHSVLSSVLYINSFRIRLAEKKELLEKRELKLLRMFLFYNGYVIARHHSSLQSFGKFLESFSFDNPGDCYDAVEVMKEAGGQIWRQPVLIKEKFRKYRYDGLVQKAEEQSIQEAAAQYAYERLLYSLLTASDYYAASEFFSGTETKEFGTMKEVDAFYQAYQSSQYYSDIRAYEKSGYGQDLSRIQKKDFTVLRNELFLDAERAYQKKKEENLNFLSAPTGSGKTNCAVNLSLLMAKDSNANKIFYVYPFNTLVEQTKHSLEQIFKAENGLMEQITVINSITPMKCDDTKWSKEKSKEPQETNEMYERALLNRQFYNYPWILTTNVSLFHLMFREKQEDVFGFHQLLNSVIVLDEVQNYNNLIWSEIIQFFQTFAELLSIKVIFMSATLPELNRLLSQETGTAQLIEEPEKYFSHPLFAGRVEVDYHLLDWAEEREQREERLFQHILGESKKKKKILMEFISKRSAEQFYQKLVKAREEGKFSGSLELMTGDSNAAERNAILRNIKSGDSKEGLILVATQVVEAGIDIDMDIGYKNVSMLDSEEQFIGRINRSALRKGIAYFFLLDSASGIYQHDFRVNKSFTIVQEEMREVFRAKRFSDYYAKIIAKIKEMNLEMNGGNLKRFFQETVGMLQFKEIAERMELISDDNWSISLFLSRVIELEDGSLLDGREVWKTYEALLQNKEMDYAERRVKLSRVSALMDYFIYQVKRGSDIKYSGRIGELYLLENGEEFFEHNVFCREKLEKFGALFFD